MKGIFSKMTAVGGWLNSIALPDAEIGVSPNPRGSCDCDCHVTDDESRLKAASTALEGSEWSPGEWWECAGVGGVWAYNCELCANTVRNLCGSGLGKKLIVGIYCCTGSENRSIKVGMNGAVLDPAADVIMPGSCHEAQEGMTVYEQSCQKCVEAVRRMAVTDMVKWERRRECSDAMPQPRSA